MGALIPSLSHLPLPSIKFPSARVLHQGLRPHSQKGIIIHSANVISIIQMSHWHTCFQHTHTERETERDREREKGGWREGKHIKAKAEVLDKGQKGTAVWHRGSQHPIPKLNIPFRSHFLFHLSLLLSLSLFTPSFFSSQLCRR